MSRGLALLLVIVACADPEPADPTPPTTGGETTVDDTSTSVTATDAPPALVAEASGETEERAVAAARLSLREQVLGPWGRAAPVTLVDTAVITTEPSDSGFTARVALDDGQLRALVDSLPERLPRRTFGGAFADRVAPLQESAIANFVCERRRALLADESCEVVDVEDQLRVAAEALRPLTLEPFWAGGVPVDDEGRPLRKPAVQLMLGPDPAGQLTGLPFLVTPVGEGEPVRVSVDPVGVALVNASPGEGLVATLDRASLVPPLDSLFPELRTALRPRRVSLRQWALVTGERTEEAFSEALARSLRERGAGARRSLEADRGRALKAARGSRRVATLRALANEHRGELDVVLVARVESHFASRMGSRRTWYEARAEVDVYLAWTGESLGSFEAQGNESGIGDERAEAAARAKVAEDIAGQLAASPALGVARGATAAAALREEIIAAL